MQPGSIIRVNGKTMRVIGRVSSDVTVQLTASGELSTIPASEMRDARLVSERSRSRQRREMARVRRVPPTTTVFARSEKAPNRAERGRGNHALYLACVGNNIYKVGRSKNVKKRLHGLQTCVFDKVRIVKTWDDKAPRVSAMETAVKRGIRARQQVGGTEVFKAPNDRAAISFIYRSTKSLE